MGTQRRVRCRAGGLVAAVTATTMAMVLTWSGDGVAAEARSLVAGASAQGMRITYTVPDQFAVSQIVDGGGPVAQASVDTTGKAIGFASLPYPGENGVTAPGLLTFATGQQVPPYPFYAEANHPTTADDEVTDPSGWYSLRALADAGRAAGSAAMTFGGPEAPASQSKADATGTTDPSETRLEAVSVNEALSFGDGVLKIGSVTSRSLTTYAAGDREPETTSELLIEGARIGDQPVTIGPDGIHAAEQTVPGPVDGGASAELLKQAGITVRTVSSEPVEGGAALQMLEVTVKHAVPGAAVQGTLVYQIGGASSFIILGEDEPGLGLDEAASVETPPAPAPAASPAAETTAAPTGPVPGAPAAAPVTGGGPPSPTVARPGGDGPDVSSAAPSSPPPSPLPAPFDALNEMDAANGGPGVDGAAPAAGDSDWAAPAATAQPVAAVRDLRDQMKPLIVIPGAGAALLLAVCGAWCLRRSPAAT